MPYKRGQNWVAQVRKDGKRKERVFQTKKEALAWESGMKRKSVEDWNEKTNTVCLGDWIQKYLDYAKSRFTQKTYKEKCSMFRRFFKHIDPVTSVSELKAAHVMEYIMAQKEKRSGYVANKDRKNIVAAWNWGLKRISGKSMKSLKVRTK
jgi:hypothetical protein